MGNANIEFHPKVAADIRELQINQIEFSQIRNKILEVSQDIEFSTSRMREMPLQFRKIKYENKRIVIWLSKNTIYVIKIFHRRAGYGEKSLKELLKLIKDYTG